MKPFLRFLALLVTEISRDDLFGLANALTYKLLLAVFPFIIFLMTVLGSLNIDASVFANLAETLPPQIIDILDVFVAEVTAGRSVGLMSVSLIVTVFSASSGFRAIIVGINKSYGEKDTRNAMQLGVISLGLVLLFAAAIAICLIALIFGDRIITLADRYLGLPMLTATVFAVARSFGVMAALLAAVCVIYKISSVKKVRLVSVVPGGAVTVTLWTLASKAFEVYITNFSRFSIVYGSLASVFILMIWLNIMSVVLLIGSEINAMLTVE